jgi:hypothetical protein
MSFLRQIVHSLPRAVKQHLRQWTRRDNHSPIRDTALSRTRSKSELGPCVGYLTHPFEFLPDEWLTSPQSAIMRFDPKTHLFAPPVEACYHCIRKGR